MKKLLFNLLILACAWSLPAQTISRSTALEVAASYFSAKTGRTATRMTTAQTSAQRSGNPAYYVCSPADGKGFVIVSGTRSTVPILAYSPEGRFSTDNMSPEARYWLQGYQEQVAEIAARRLQPTPQLNALWQTLESGRDDAPENSMLVAPILRTRWDQAPLYNQDCPTSGTMQAPTGCVATAMAQIMKYWNFPVTGSTYVEDVDSGTSNGISGTFGAWVGGDYYHWNDMPDTLSAGMPQNQIDEVARLSYHCGLAAKMNYGTAESGANTSNTLAAFKDIFGYEDSKIEWRSQFSAEVWLGKIRDELASGRPVFYFGADPAGGHAWVCDGYEDDMFHMNWGWGGVDNGFYYLSDLHPVLTGYHFNATQGAIVGIQAPGCIPFYEGFLLPGTSPLVAADYIHLTGGTLQPGMVSIIHAGNAIVLKPGFKGLAGSTAHLYIEGCGGALSPAGEDRSPAETSVIESSPIGLQVFPNPFVGSTTIAYNLPTAQQVDIQILSLVGNRVAQPVQQEYQEAGAYEYRFDAGDLPAGIYLLVMQTGGQRQTRRLVLSR